MCFHQLFVEWWITDWPCAPLVSVLVHRLKWQAESA